MRQTRGEAQQHADRIQAFHQELRHLTERQVLTLTETQLHALSQHHRRVLDEYRERFNIDPNSQSKKLSLGMRISAFLGALALAASVWFCFYQIWDLLTQTMQISLVAAASAASFALTLWLKPRDTEGYFTQIAAMLAVSCLVLNSVVLGHVFNLSASCHSVGLWGLYALLLGRFCQSRIIEILALFLLAAYSSMLLAQTLGFSWQQAAEQPELWLVAAVALFAGGQRSKAPACKSYQTVGAFIGLGALSILAFWGNSSLLPLPSNITELVYLGLSLLASSGCIYLGINQQKTWLYRIGTSFVLLILLAKAFDWLWNLLPAAVFFLLLSAVAIAVLVVLKRQRASHSQESSL